MRLWCGRMQVGWYDRKICRVRDLSCGDTRIFLELEVAPGSTVATAGGRSASGSTFWRTIRTTPSALPITSAGAVDLRRYVAADFVAGSAEYRPRPSTSSTCKPSLRERAGLVRR